jgi:hypothetical protein
MLRISRRRAAGFSAVALTLIAGITIGTTFADEGESGTDHGDVPAGVPDTQDDTSSTSEGSPNLTEAITTSGTNFDPTIVTKFIPARAFIAHQGAGADADLIAGNGNGCISATAAGGGAVADLFAPIELPDGSRIRNLAFYGSDSNVAEDIQITLNKSAWSTSVLVDPSRTDSVVTSFATTGADGVQVLASTDNLNEVTGSISGNAILTPTTHNFYNVEIVLNNAAGAQHVVCGVEVRYQVAAPSGEAGTVFHAIDPVRAYDSRIAAYGATAGTFAPNANKVISVADAHDIDTGAVTVADVVPANATAITYNLVAAGATGPNFLAITAGDAASFGASAINMGGATLALANGGTVEIAADRTVKVWLGGGPGSSDVVLDVTGYYTAPLASPNMAG